MPASLTRDSVPDLSAKPAGNYRWVICALLFFATTINYVDRAVISILKPNLMAELNWSETNYGDIMAAFSFAYAIGYAAAGRAIDLVGVRIGYAVAVVAWSLAAMGGGLMRTVTQFMVIRSALGIAEGANFPACVKSISEWFPRRERAFATGIFNSGSNVGVIVAPILIPWLTTSFGWPYAFYVTGALGFVWLIFWLLVYEAPERHPRVTPEELAYIRSDPPEPQVHIPWLQLLGYRQVWAFIVGMALSSPIWWFYLGWTPGFLKAKFGVDLTEVAAPLITIYLLADVGSIAGGWFSGWLMRKGFSVNAARKLAMLACALCVTPVFLAAVVDNKWVAVVLIGVAASAHQGFSANLYTLVSDMAPKSAISSIVGLGGMTAGFAAMGFQMFTGRLLDSYPGAYLVIFIVASGAYLVNLLLIHLLVPRLEPMVIPEEA
ncbi:MAG: MFS transporter [Pirellulales bacterium]|nr:MFS transporter [Pirellulales bacterium]